MAICRRKTAFIYEPNTKSAIGQRNQLVGVYLFYFSTLLTQDRPMISGYLGHAFSVDFLRKNFPGCMFVYLKRDEMSNIYSMIRTYKEFEKNRKNFNWMSLKPIGWQDNIEEEVTDKVLWQYKSIKQKVYDTPGNDDYVYKNRSSRLYS